MRLALLGLVLIGCGQSGNGSPPDGGAADQATAGDAASAQDLAMPPGAFVKHVVVIVQENRTVDNLFNGFPGAETVQQGEISDGGVIPLASASLVQSYDVSHAHTAWVKAYNGGKMNGFDRIDGTLHPYTYVPQSETQPYWMLAQQFTFADHMFQSNTGPSFVAHQYLVAGHSPEVSTDGGASGFVDENPGGGVWGCDSAQGTTSTFLAADGTEHPGPFPCFDPQTLGDVMDVKGVTWRYYAPAIGASGAIWSTFDAVSHIRKGPDWSQDVISPETNVLTDVAAGTLAQVTWVVPKAANSDHLKSTTLNGPDWVASIVNAVMASKFWPETVIFIVWDDWGGLYDHVPPPQLDSMGLSFRVPLIVVSPYARHGYVSKQQHEFGSILRYIEETFDLPSMTTIDPNATDARADDLGDCFDYSQMPRPPRPVPTRRAHREFIAEPPSSVPPDDD